jgi:hypothetical protein
MRRLSAQRLPELTGGDDCLPGGIRPAGHHPVNPVDPVKKNKSDRIYRIQDCSSNLNRLASSWDRWPIFLRINRLSKVKSLSRTRHADFKPAFSISVM